MLRSVDCIAAEDTRHTRKLLTHFDIRADLVRYDEHAHDRAAPKLLRLLSDGKSVAQVTDAGMPGISDPGLRLANAARETGIPVDVIPGPDAVTTALVASGLPTMPYTFHGFAPRKKGDRTRRLESLSPGTHVFYESPARVIRLLESLADVLPDADVAICRELTKKFARVSRGRARDLLDATEGGERGEVVVLLHVATMPAAAVTDDALREAVQRRVTAGLSTKEAVRQVADEFQVPKRRVYDIAHAR